MEWKGPKQEGRQSSKHVKTCSAVARGLNTESGTKERVVCILNVPNAFQIFGERERDIYRRFREERASPYLEAAGEKNARIVCFCKNRNRNRNADSRRSFSNRKQSMEPGILTITSAFIRL